MSTKTLGPFSGRRSCLGLLRGMGYLYGEATVENPPKDGEDLSENEKRKLGKHAWKGEGDGKLGNILKSSNAMKLC